MKEKFFIRFRDKNNRIIPIRNLVELPLNPTEKTRIEKSFNEFFIQKNQTLIKREDEKIMSFNFNKSPLKIIADARRDI